MPWRAARAPFCGTVSPSSTELVDGLVEVTLRPSYLIYNQVVIAFRTSLEFSHRLEVVVLSRGAPTLAGTLMLNMPQLLTDSPSPVALPHQQPPHSGRLPADRDLV